MYIKKELEKFKKYKENYEFTQKEIEEINGLLYCEGFPLLDEDGKEIGECDKWINAGYKNSGKLAKALSNLFPYEFEFRGKKLNCIESFFQGIKFRSIEMQNYVLRYSGLNANRVSICSEYNWKETGIIYWQGERINRFSEKYDDLVDELYISAIQNPLYRNALKQCDKDIIHTIGGEEKSDTVFTRFEFEKQLNSLRDFLRGDI